MCLLVVSAAYLDSPFWDLPRFCGTGLSIGGILFLLFELGVLLFDALLLTGVLLLLEELLRLIVFATAISNPSRVLCEVQKD